MIYDSDKALDKIQCPLQLKRKRKLRKNFLNLRKTFIKYLELTTYYPIVKHQMFVL